MDDHQEVDFEDHENPDEYVKRLVESAKLSDMATSPTQAPPQPKRRGRYLLPVVIIIVLGLIAGWITWQHRLTRLRGLAPAAQAAPHESDVVTVNENQLRQVSVGQVIEQPVVVERNTTGKVSFNEDRLTPVFTPYAGRVLEVSAAKGASVRPGQPLLVLESPDLVVAQNDLTSARSDVAKAKIALETASTAAERARRLHEREALATKDLQQAEADLARAQDEYRRSQAALAAVENRLALFGKSGEEVARLGARPDGIDRRVVIRAPIAGTIVERKVGLGQYVKPDMPDPLFLISDLSTLWVFADVYESDLAGVHLHAPVEVSIAAYPGRTFTAHVSFISPTVDPTTRTVRVRCLVQNAGGLLKPDMFAQVKINSAQQQSALVVPAEAVVSEGNDAVVFVEEAPGRFRRQRVQVGHEAGGRVVASGGLRPGERIVIRGALLLGELSKGEK